MPKLNFLIRAFIAIFLFAGCSKSSSEPEQLCNSVSSFTAVQQDDALKLVINSGGTPLYYECVAIPAGNPGPTNGSGTYGIAVPPNNSLYLKDLFVSSGTYLIYVRAICTAGPGNWAAPVTVNINAYCARPFDLTYVDSYFQGLKWSVDYAASQFQVQYGVKGFSLGSGTIVTTVATNFDDARMNANTNYDFYVRAGCGSGWSSWVGPFTFLSTGIKNLCTAPSNVNYAVITSGGTPVGASFTWSYNGEKKFEYTGVFQGAPIGSNTIYTYNASAGNPPITMTASRNTNYDFYIRAVCTDGSKTAWVGPTLFNIH